MEISGEMGYLLGMKRDRRRTKSLILLVFLLGFCSNVSEEEPFWIKIDEGLQYNEFISPIKSEIGDSRILVVRIDPRFHDLILLSASEISKGKEIPTIREWVENNNLIAGINGGMFQKDILSNVGYMKNFGHMNNPRVHKTYASVLAFNPRKDGLPPAHVYDVDTDDMKEIIAGYNTVIQNLRLIKRPGVNRWARQEKRWSEAALGQDQDGNILFIFSQSPYSMHDLGNILLGLPINIVCAQHLEGGSAASFYLRHNGTEIVKRGLHRASTVVGSEDLCIPVPNVIGIKKKTRQAEKGKGR